MEEKERFEYIHNDEIGDGILDIKTNNEIYDIGQMSTLLNQQDKRIKELEEMNKKLDERGFRNFDAYMRCSKKYTKLLDENQQFKKQLSNMEKIHKHIMSGEYIPANVAEKSLKLSEQSQKQLAIEELEKMKKFLYSGFAVDNEEIEKEIDNQIKELKGEE